MTTTTFLGIKMERHMKNTLTSSLFALLVPIAFLWYIVSGATGVSLFVEARKAFSELTVGIAMFLTYGVLALITFMECYKFGKAVEEVVEYNRDLARSEVKN